MAVNVIKFKKADFEGTPDDSVVLEFPNKTVTVFKSNNKIYAEILQQKKRISYEGTVQNADVELKKIVEKVMSKMNQIVTITKMNK